MSEPGSETAKHYALGPVWRVLLNVIVIFLASQIAGVLIVESYLAATGAPAGTFDNSTLAQFVYVLVAEGLAGGSVLYIVKRQGLSLSSIGLGRKPRSRDVAQGLLGFFIFYLVLVVVSLGLSLIFPDIDKGDQDVGFNNLNNIVDTVLAFVALVIIPPLGEETLVRGYLYSGLRSRFKFIPAMLVTSVLFGIAHLGTGSGPGLLWAAGVNTFVLSLVLVYLRERTGALYAGILVHALNNLIAFGFHFHAVLF